VGVSIGVGSLHEGDDRIGDVIARADAAMYEEKRADGRPFRTAG
jgi:PleD family two-component response regulator